MGISKYNVVWNSQSKTSAESMPLSLGGGTGLNVWVENSKVYFYAANSGNFDENGDLLKYGRIVLSFSDDPFVQEFRQELILQKSEIKISGSGPKTGKFELIITGHIDGHYVSLKYSVEHPIIISIGFETWRDETRSLKHKNGNWENVPGFHHTIWQDYVSVQEGRIQFYHQNNNTKTVAPHLIKQQQMQEFSEIIPDPSRNLIFGGVISVKNGSIPEKYRGKYLRTPFSGWQMASKSPVTTGECVVVLNTGYFDHLDKWVADTEAKLHLFTDSDVSSKMEIDKNAFWDTFWGKSHIIINPEKADQKDPAWQIGRNYQLFRYMLACNLHGKFPLKFNGGIFSFDPPIQSDQVMKPEYFAFDSAKWSIKDSLPTGNITADYHVWGADMFMAQNQRHIAFPNFKCGDFDLMLPSINFYRDLLPVAQARVQKYWKHYGACYVEPLGYTGLTIGSLATAGDVSAKHLVHHYTMQLQFAYLCILYGKYSQNDLSSYMPFIRAVVIFFNEHYKKDRNGKIVLFPTNSLEAYINTTNPIDLVAGLKVLLQELLLMPDSQLNYGLTTSIRNYFEKMQAALPSIPVMKRKGHLVLAPAQKFRKLYNDCEFSEMDAVYPWSLYGIWSEETDLKIARDTWIIPDKTRKRYKGWWSWQSCASYTAFLGLEEETKQYLINKFSDQNAMTRFPAFFGPGHDWIPDHNWGGSAMSSLQNMLIHCVNDKIYLLPAWPLDWDVDFKLYATQNTIVDVSIRNGEIKRLEVNPSHRKNDIVICSKNKLLN